MRKCITCGFELGDEEQYCGNCGTKAPNGAVDKTETEFENITPNEKNPLHWTMSWGFHNVILYQDGYGGAYCNIFMLFWFNFVIIFIYLICLIFIDVFGKTEYSFFKTCINVLEVAVYFKGMVLSSRTYKELKQFQKEAIGDLKKLCLIRILAFPIYSIIQLVIFKSHIYVLYIACAELILGVLALLIANLYYSKRTDAFIH